MWWGSMQFDEGDEETKKYFVLLVDVVGNNDEQFVVALTTSRGEKHYGNARCASPCGGLFFRIEARNENCFPFTTWVQFDNHWYLSRSSLEQLKTIAGLTS